MEKLCIAFNFCKGGEDILKEEFMERALQLSLKGLGYTNPNPMVGAVIVKDGKIIGEGYHKKYGEAHAEVNAFDNATEDVKGAEMYVTLEPCAHYGKTPPCAERIVKEGIKKVYIAIGDPNLKVGGKGIKILKDAGIEVEVGFLEDKCNEINEVFLHYIKTKTPFVIAKWAMTLDGKIATSTGDSKWITNEKSREYVHKLRQRVAAILVGHNCVEKDDPMLNVRLENLENGVSNPIRVIVARKGNIDCKLKVVQTAREIPTIVAAKAIDDIKRRELESYGVEVLLCEERDGRVSIKDLVKKLGEKNIDSLLIEGGGEILASAFEENVVNKISAFIAPKVIGGRDAVTAIEGKGHPLMNMATKVKNIKYKTFDDDILIEGDVECSQE